MASSDQKLPAFLARNRWLSFYETVSTSSGHKKYFSAPDFVPFFRRN
jgi:hypothetical protein